MGIMKNTFETNRDVPVPQIEGGVKDSVPEGQQEDINLLASEFAQELLGPSARIEAELSPREVELNDFEGIQKDQEFRGVMEQIGNRTTYLKQKAIALFAALAFSTAATAESSNVPTAVDGSSEQSRAESITKKTKNTNELVSINEVVKTVSAPYEGSANILADTSVEATSKLNKVSKLLGFDIRSALLKERVMARLTVDDPEAQKIIIVYDQIHTSSDPKENAAIAPFAFRSQTTFGLSIGKMLKAQKENILIMEEGYSMEQVDVQEGVEAFIKELPNMGWIQESVQKIIETLNETRSEINIVAILNAVKEWAEKRHGKQTKTLEGNEIRVFNSDGSTAFDLKGGSRFEETKSSFQQQLVMISTARYLSQLDSRIKLTTAEPNGYTYASRESGMPGTEYRKKRDENMAEQAVINTVTHEGPVVLIVGADHHESFAEEVRKHNELVKSNKKLGVVVNVLNFTSKF